MLVPLDQLAAEINVRLTKAAKADSHRVSAGKLLAEARERVPVEAPGMRWHVWCRENITRSWSDVQACLRLADSPDPEAAHEAEKAKTRERIAGIRARKKEKARGGEVRTSPDAACDDADLRAAVLVLPAERLAAFQAWLNDYCRERFS